MATENKNGFNPLSAEEQKAIQDMSIDDLLSSVRDTLNAPVGASSTVQVKPAANTPAADPTAATVQVPAAAATAVLERQETMIYQDLAPQQELQEAPAVEETAVVPQVNTNEAPEFLRTKPKKEKKPDVEERIYNILNTAEKIAVKLAQINQIIKKATKKRKKKNQKLGKVDKKTGTLILKKEQKQPRAKMEKRNKAKKK